MTSPKHSSFSQKSFRGRAASLLVKFMKLPFRQCTLNPPRKLTKRRLYVGPRIPGYMLIALFGIFLLGFSYRDDMNQAIFTKNLYNNNTVAYPSHADQDEFAIFYHIFVPPEEPEQSNALRIIHEQMHQIGKSYAGTLKPKLYYNTLGTPNVVTEPYMAKYCGKFNLDCELLDHYDKGMEELTLQEVHDYCSMPDSNFHQGIDNPELAARRVVYMHNKGSFHSNRFNEQWRKMMTYSVTSEECLHPPDDTCNLCGLYFIAERGLFMPGNFWTARCDYIQKLLPPQEFADTSTEVMKEALYLHLKHQFSFDMYNFIIDNYGIARYAAELWSGSHPSIQPCDMSLGKKENFGTGYGDPFFEWVLSIWDPFQLTIKSLRWAMAPSLPLKIPVQLKESSPWGFQYLVDTLCPWLEPDGYKIGEMMDHVLDFFLLLETPAARSSRTKHRMRQFTYLAGNLYKWINIYDQVPEKDSWIWKWFPDGETWSAELQEHGKDVVEIVTAKNVCNQKEHLDPIFYKGYQRRDFFNKWLLRLLREI